MNILEMSNNSRESQLYLAKLAEQSERFEGNPSIIQRGSQITKLIDMMGFMKQLAIESGELSVDERNLFSVAFKNVIGALRSSWRSVSSLEQKEETKGNSQHLILIKEYRAKIEKELDIVCQDVLSILTDHLLPKASNGESKVFYSKMRGDYYRYLAEFLTGERRKEVSDLSLDSYEAATKIASAELPSTHPLRLGLALNFSVFYYEIMMIPAKARQLAKQAFDDAIAQLDSLSEESYKDSTLIMQLLRDNLTLWTSDMDEDMSANGGDNAATETKPAEVPKPE